jgi:hypothetical protein
LHKSQGVIDVKACRVDGLANSKHFVNRWPATPKKAVILYVVQPVRG